MFPKGPLWISSVFFAGPGAKGRRVFSGAVFLVGETGAIVAGRAFETDHASTRSRYGPFGPSTVTTRTRTGCFVAPVL